MQLELSDGYAWVADSQRLTGDLAGARANRVAQRRILQQLLAIDPQNVPARTDLLGNQLALARLDAAAGRYTDAVAGLDRGRTDAKALLKLSPGNREIATQARAFELFKVHAAVVPADQRPPTHALLSALGGCAASGGAEADREIAQFCQLLRARVLAASGDRPGASRVLAAARPAPGGDALSPRWGLNFAEEMRLAGG